MMFLFGQKASQSILSDPMFSSAPLHWYIPNLHTWEIDDIADDVKDSFFARNKVPVEMNSNLSLEHPGVTHVLSSEEYPLRGLDYTDWEVFLKEEQYNANNVYLFTFPGYSCDGKTAIVYVEYTCGNFCSSGWLHFMMHVEGDWVQTHVIRQWVS